MMAKAKVERKLSALDKMLQKDYGDIIYSADMISERRGEPLSVTLSMDIALHGGFQEGTIISIAGNPASGKTTLCLHFIAKCQALGKKCYYLDVEGRLQHSLLKTIDGLDIENLSIISSSKDKFLTAEDYLTIMEKILSQEEGSVVILDSIASLCTEAVFTTDHTESRKMMGLAGIVYNSIRKLAQVLPVMRSTLILITHVQANPSPYGGPTEMGGNAIKFGASTRITCLSSSEFPKDGDKIGRESKFKIYKSALGPGTGEAMFYIRYGHGYDRELDVFKLAEELGIIIKAGAWYSFEDNKSEEKKFQGADNLVAFLRENPEDMIYLENKIKSSIGQKV